MKHSITIALGAPDLTMRGLTGAVAGALTKWTTSGLLSQPERELLLKMARNATSQQDPTSSPYPEPNHNPDDQDPVSSLIQRRVMGILTQCTMEGLELNDDSLRKQSLLLSQADPLSCPPLPYHAPPSRACPCPRLSCGAWAAM